MVRFADRPILRFPSRIAVAQSVSISCMQSIKQRKGYVVALEGESGSGRSTALDTIVDEVRNITNAVRTIRLSFGGGYLRVLPRDGQTLLHSFLAGVKWSAAVAEPFTIATGPVISTAITRAVDVAAEAATPATERSAVLRTSEMAEFRRAIRRLAGNGPLLLLVDDIASKASTSLVPPRSPNPLPLCSGGCPAVAVSRSPASASRPA